MPPSDTIDNTGKQENFIRDHTESMDVRFVPQGSQSLNSFWLKT